MIALGVAALAGSGVHFLYTAVVLDWDGMGMGPRMRTGKRGPRLDIELWLRQAGLEEVDRREFTSVVVMLFVIGFLAGYAAFGGIGPALVIGGFAGSFPVASYRRRRVERRQRAQDAWPRMIEEVRVQTSSLGRSVPQALFEVGGRGPQELRSSFAAAHREWLLTTDLPRTFTVLKQRLADPTVDMTCETLLIAHELGGTDLDLRLAALAEDRLRDGQGRKDARSRQAGARFARSFVLIVPAGMALAGMSIGNGRAAYTSGTGQMVVLVAVMLVVGCWGWAGRVMHLPETRRVFTN